MLDRHLESSVNIVHGTSAKINNALKIKCKTSLFNGQLLKPAEIVQSALQSVIHSVAVYDHRPYIQSSRLVARLRRLCPAQTSGSRVCQRCRALAGFPSRYLVLEDHAEQLSSQSVGQPRVLDDGHLEALAAEHGVVVGVNGSAHSLDNHQVGLTLPHHHRQHFVQTARQ